MILAIPVVHKRAMNWLQNGRAHFDTPVYPLFGFLGSFRLTVCRKTLKHLGKTMPKQKHAFGTLRAPKACLCLSVVSTTFLRVLQKVVRTSSKKPNSG